jgi:alcohol dehydrogenase
MATTTSNPMHRYCSPKKPLGKLAGTGFTVANRDKTLMAAYPPLIAVPTTAGTGSETSVAAVFLHDGLKKIVTDPVLVPRVAVLDPDVTLSLPKHITAATGMDALTHAVESYLSTWANARSRQYEHFCTFRHPPPPPSPPFHPPSL